METSAFRRTAIHRSPEGDSPLAVFSMATFQQLSDMRARAKDQGQRVRLLRSFATQVLQKSVTTNILVQGRPPFAPLSPVTLAIKRRRGQPLWPGIATGEMFNSLIPGGKDNVLRVEGNSVIYGTSNWKAEKFQKGDPMNRQPPRPFVVFQTEDYTNMETRYKTWLLTGEVS